MHLFPEYTATPVAPPRNRETQAALTVAKNRLPAETVEPADLLQCASDFDTALKTVASDAATSTRNEDALPLRELLGLNEALQRSRGALGDNRARLYQLEADIAQGERELHGEEAANDHEKKRCIQERLSQQRDERSSRLEAAAADREALRTQFSRIRETIDRMLNEDTTLAERLRTLFREQGVTIASVLTALGSSCRPLCWPSKTHSAGVGPHQHQHPPAVVEPLTGSKNNWKTLAGWLKALAGKVAAELPGFIGAIVSWLLKTAGSVAVWLA